MANTDNSTLKLKIILAALETETQALADEIGEQRPVLSGIISGTRKAKKARYKLADALSKKMFGLIVLEEPEAGKAV